MDLERKRIGELLIEQGYISASQLAEALKVQETKDQKICNILIDLGYLTEAKFLEFLSAMPGTASIQLSSLELEPKLLELVRNELAHRLELVPIGKIGNVLTVAMVCPLDDVGQKELEQATGMKVRPVLCSRSSVISMLERHYGVNYKDAFEPEEPAEPENISALGESLRLSGVARLVEEIEELPTLPAIVQRVSQIASDPNSSAADLADVIATDGSISAKLLKLANSPAFGFSRKISQIQHAVALLGFNETRELVTSVAVLDFLNENDDLDFRDYWNHSFSCATLSRLIAKKLKAGTVETAFVAGLLHDVGKVALSMKLPGKLQRAAELRAAGDMTPIQAEEAVLGLTHAEVGYLLGEHWLLPPNLTEAIRYHHLPQSDTSASELACIVHLADAFCKVPVLELLEDFEIDKAVLDVLDNIGISEAVFQRTLEEYSEIAIDIPPL